MVEGVFSNQSNKNCHRLPQKFLTSLKINLVNVILPNNPEIGKIMYTKSGIFRKSAVFIVREDALKTFQNSKLRTINIKTKVCLVLSNGLL